MVVILGIMAVVATAKYSDMKAEAHKANASGVYAACQAAAAINFAAGLAGKPANQRPAYVAGLCSDGMLINSTGENAYCLMAALDGVPAGWNASGDTIRYVVDGVTLYTISIDVGETTTAKAVLGIWPLL